MPLVWRAEYAESVIVLCTFIVIHLLHHYSVLTSLADGILLSRLDENPIVRGILNKLCGAFLFGVIPALVVAIPLGNSLNEYGLVLRLQGRFIVFAIGVSAVLFPLIFLFARRSESAAHLREAPVGNWTCACIIAHCASWVVYLVAYELCVRGFLLFSLERVAGGWPAVFIVTSIYSALHLHKGKGEALGSVFAGFVFGAVTFVSRSIFPAVLIHSVIAVTVDLVQILRYISGSERK